MILMKVNIEKEYKMLLSKQQFDKIVENEELSLVIQDNYYYETGKENAGLRIRNIEDLYIMTYKIYENGKVIEYEYQVNDANIENEHILKFLKKQNIEEKPKLLGILQTSRYYKKLKKGEIALDRNLYLNKIDYEIEYEVYDEGSDEQELIDFLSKHKIDYIENKKTKYQRFKEVYNEKN